MEARTSGSLAGVREVGSLQLVSESGSTEICNELITIAVLKKSTSVQLPCKVRVCAAGGLQLLLCCMLGECGRLVCSCRGGAVGGGLASSGLPRVEDDCRQVQGLRYVVVLASAFWCIFLELCLGGSGGSSPRTCLRCFYSSACYGVLSEVLCRLVAWGGDAPLWRCVARLCAFVPQGLGLA
ncbi:hypothetical protein Taro_049163 [Colocasia esculenta]|uniref:Uncharacterized protein n=1 Tax=Colocasia esculenta TaxID=4460 RepID=A0A843XA22_COLES|nr:hypothetical protein [Colocasia esculenta]